MFQKKSLTLAPMTRKDSCDHVLLDFIPASACLDVIRVHKSWMKISCKDKAFIEDQGYTVIAVPGCVEDLSVQPYAGQKRPAVLQLQDEIIVLLDLNIWEGLAFEMIGKRRHKIHLAFRQDKFRPVVFEVLDQSGMVGVKMGDEQVLELLEGDPLSL